MLVTKENSKESGDEWQKFNWGEWKWDWKIKEIKLWVQRCEEITLDVGDEIVVASC